MGRALPLLQEALWAAAWPSPLPTFSLCSCAVSGVRCRPPPPPPAQSGGIWAVGANIWGVRAERSRAIRLADGPTALLTGMAPQRLWGRGRSRRGQGLPPPLPHTEVTDRLQGRSTWCHTSWHPGPASPPLPSSLLNPAPCGCSCSVPLVALLRLPSPQDHLVLPCGFSPL